VQQTLLLFHFRPRLYFACATNKPQGPPKKNTMSGTHAPRVTCACLILRTT
jgi:hypothetical protein